MVLNSVARKRARRPGIVRFFADERKWVPYLFVAPFFITFAVFMAYPMLRALSLALQTSRGFATGWTWVGLANYGEALKDKNIVVALRNVVYFTLGSLITQIPAGLLVALLLTSERLRWRGGFRSLFYLPTLLPGVTMGVVGVWLFSQSRGFANALWLVLGGTERIAWGTSPSHLMPMMLIIGFWRYVGYHAVYLMAGVTGIDPEILEAATIDGAGYWQRLWHVVIPLLRPVFAFLCITAAAGSLLAYDVPFMLLATGTGAVSGGLSGPSGQGWFFVTYIVWLAFDRFRMGYATAIAWLVFVLSLSITFVQVKLFGFGEAK